MSKLEIQLYDVIDAWSTGGSRNIADLLRFHGAVEEVHIRINSPGGDVFEAFAACNLLKKSEAKIVVTVDGLAASAATFFVAIAHEVRMGVGAMLMIHEARIMNHEGTADELRKQAEILDSINSTMADLYASKAARKGKTREDIVEAMASETWLSAEQAIDWGLADSIDSHVEADPEVTALAVSRPKGHELITRFAAIAKHPKETVGMNLSAIAKRLNLAANADASAVIEKIQEALDELKMLLDASEVEESEPVEASAVAGKIRAAMVASRELPKAQSRIAELENKIDGIERASIVEEMRAKGQVNPAMESTLIPTMSIAQLKAFAASAPRLIPVAVAQPAANAVELRDTNGKSWSELKPGERAKLKDNNPELYAAMRTSATRKNA